MNSVRTVAALCATVLIVLAPQTGSADDMVMFNYEGRVKVSGSAYTGAGLFKFVILNNADSSTGDRTLWSLDDTSVDGSEPTASVSVDVADGIFNVMVGDPDLGMLPINSSIFGEPGPLRLRVWFNDGVHGFERLHPDSKLVNLTLITLRTGDWDFTIYVSGATGNDANNGYAPATAKKTIRAAVRVIPPLLNCNVTVDISAGVYREEVDLHGISTAKDKTLLIVGDRTWTPVSSGDPSVRICGRNSDESTEPRVRDYALYARQCSGLELRGLQFDGCAREGLRIIGGNVVVTRCQSTNNSTPDKPGTAGMAFEQGAEVDVFDSAASFNAGSGLAVVHNSRGFFTRCEAVGNGVYGLRLDANSNANVYETINFSENGDSGMAIQRLCYVGYGWPVSGYIINNGKYGMYVNYNSIIAGTANSSAYTYGNALGGQYAHLGGAIY